MEEQLIKTPEEAMKEELQDQGWTPEQIAAWENDLDSLADLFEPFEMTGYGPIGFRAQASEA